MLYNRGGKLSHNINACHGFRRAGVVGARRCENYDRTWVWKNPWYLGLEFVHTDPIVHKYQN